MVIDIRSKVNDMYFEMFYSHEYLSDKLASLELKDRINRINTKHGFPKHKLTKQELESMGIYVL